MLAATRIVEGAADWSSAMVLVTLTVAMFAFSALLYTVRQLRSAQHRIATLAVAEERSRLARDLHDVLGHSLTTITVKAGLARRMLESADPGRAIAEVRDVEALARQAMTEVRATVSGYREASLGAELVGARAALSAAGITPDLPNAVDNVAAGLQETFAYALREGVTNVIRHSQASQCQVRLGDTWLEVLDNGRVVPEQVVSSRVDGGGHGLSGLAERVRAINGTLDAGPLPTGGFLLRVSVADENGGLVGRR
jgi:two-component system sensor histidine kinase DesK